MVRLQFLTGSLGTLQQALQASLSIPSGIDVAEVAVSTTLGNLLGVVYVMLLVWTAWFNGRRLCLAKLSCCAGCL